MDAATKVPFPHNEKVLDYAPGSPERAGLEAATWAAAPRQAHLRNRDWALKVARESLTTRIPVG